MNDSIPKEHRRTDGTNTRNFKNGLVRRIMSVETVLPPLSEKVRGRNHTRLRRKNKGKRLLLLPHSLCGHLGCQMRESS